MCTVKLPFAGRSTGPQASVCVGGVPPLVIAHPAGTGEVSIAQVTPEPDPGGIGGKTVGPLASPVPEMVTLTVDPNGSPAFTDAAAPGVRLGVGAGLHVIVASLWSDPSLVVVTLAVLS